MNDEEMNVTLKRARDTYGNKNQILVCIEELNELACVLAKFPRYEDEEEAREKLTDSVLDEVADVSIILDHVKSIFNMSDEQVMDRMKKKVSRLQRWLDTSNSMQQTTVDRTVDTVDKDCKSCESWNNPDYWHCWRCQMCQTVEATEGVKPFYKKGL